MFRCPDCGQGKRMPGDGEGVVYLNNDEMNKTLLLVPGEHIAPIRSPEGIRKGYVRFEGEADVLCPRCGSANPVSKWLEAFEDPLKYFETENICHCGGELWMDLIPNTTKYAWICEKCNWIKPKAIVEGGA